MENMEMVQNIVNAALVLVFAAFALVTTGGVAAFFAILRANKRSLELAYQALPPEAAQVIRQIALALKQVGDLVDDVTDGEPDVTREDVVMAREALTALRRERSFTEPTGGAG
ncbi:MAG: hypothetical protein D6735_01195 [Acidobacteria bacterium]|nr:MAG: hypothetical protein D6735_01195 [Acidobacteriota bacterium]